MPSLSLEITGHVATVRLNRPEKRNAIHLPMFEELADCGRELCAAPGVRAVVLAGSGEAFCAGLDTALFATVDSAMLGALLEPRQGSPANLFQAAAWTWRDLAVPVVCALHGVVYGAGLQVALGADIRIAAPATRFSIREVAWGLVPDMGLCVLARGLVPPDALRELAYTGRVFDAAEALRHRFVTRLEDEPLAAAEAVAAAIAARSPDAVRAMKRLFAEGLLLPAAEALRLEADLQAGLIGTPNQREAALANAERREPDFD
ncbi:MAG TPA: crotonase/enoyl-CoA hydratase family protein [Woeseiaceae bacterium]|nr:crotonase/enoyl-CoA hydratase family protein [Woeseiaceae bacterium]